MFIALVLLNVAYAATFKGIPDSDDKASATVKDGRLDIPPPQSPSYPEFVYPPDFQRPRAPVGFEEASSKLIINVLKIADQPYTFYKMAARPVPTMQLKTGPDCLNFQLFIELEPSCLISIELRAETIKVTSNSVNVYLDRPEQIVLSFTHYAAFVFTFGPVAVRDLKTCQLDYQQDEFNMKVWYDKTRESNHCEVVKIVFVDGVVVRLPEAKPIAAMTKVAKTIDATTVETVTEEDETGTASTSATMWGVMALATCGVMIVVIATVLMIVRLIKKY